MHTLILKWIVARFGSLRGFDIVEVGGGFGGLAGIILSTFAVRSYSIVDLHDVQMLQRRYLGAIGPRERFAGKLSFIGAGLPNRSSLLERYDLFISSCAFSELSVKLQQTYFDELIRRSERGFVIDNRYTLANNGGLRLSMAYAGFGLLDKLLSNLFHADLQSWCTMLPRCPSSTPLNSVLFFELRMCAPTYTRWSEFWKLQS
eukprot:gnl/TRDRNA2_/TRDRNA2_127496_c0_seq1.p1 gnl/TRDRNA2_/TRDRNA2_127496_c0~~gnl/TRDRNA2_/TRDRNA2_127496_c0_seq1.p1  ORF type:complete len:203 (+),score=12.56 gnl/TRDRNA2_/TRDRNA2_127496_c0_seq1:104-712(+)